MKKLIRVVVMVLALMGISACGSNVNIEPNTTPTEPNNTIEPNVEVPKPEPKPEWEGEWETIYSYGDSPWFNNIDGLFTEGHTTDVVRVTVLDESVRMHDWRTFPDPSERSRYEPSIVNQVRVLEVFQGNTQPGNVIEIIQTGGALNGINLICSMSVPLSVGDDLLIFLRQIALDRHDNLYTPTSPAQSIYRFSSPDKSAVSISGTEVLEHIQRPDVVHSNNFPLTIGDLLSIAEENFGGVISEWDQATE